MDLPSAVGFSPPPGDPEALFGASGLIGNVAATLTELGSHVQVTAGSLAASWTGEAATSYQDLSDVISSRFHGAAGASGTAAAALRGYATELERCQREGMTAVEQAERCLKEIKAQSDRVQSAQAAGSAAQGALSAAQAQGTAARAAGPLGVVAAAAADAEALVAQVALSGAQADEQTAGKALADAQQELSVWQARGRRAWEDAETAADRASGSLQALTIVPPPLAGVAPIAPLLATAPFALPGDQCDASPGEPDEPTVGGGILPFTITGDQPRIEDFPSREPSPGDGLLPYTIPDRPPSGEHLPADEPTPGGNTITDPAPETCGRTRLNDEDEGEGGKNGKNGEADGHGANPVNVTDAQAKEHILEGDATGGGHRPGTGITGKSEFPQGWSDDKILTEISDVATDPESQRDVVGGRTVITGARDGVEIRVIVDNATGRIVTGYPTNIPRNP